MHNNILLACIVSLMISGCGNTPDAPLIKSENYALGEQAGCQTAQGSYTKDSTLFNSDPDYEKGWFAGRRNCNPSFKQE